MNKQIGIPSRREILLLRIELLNASTSNTTPYKTAGIDQYSLESANKAVDNTKPNQGAYSRKLILFGCLRTVLVRQKP
jgi:hypothetical protein